MAPHGLVEPPHWVLTIVTVALLTAVIWGAVDAAHLALPQLVPAPPTGVPLTSNQPTIPEADYNRCVNTRTEVWSACTGTSVRLVTECARTNIGEPYGFIRAPYPCRNSNARPISWGSRPARR
jgi:hypothetical protein